MDICLVVRCFVVGLFVVIVFVVEGLLLVVDYLFIVVDLMEVVGLLVLVDLWIVVDFVVVDLSALVVDSGNLYVVALLAVLGPDVVRVEVVFEYISSNLFLQVPVLCPCLRH